MLSDSTIRQNIREFSVNLCDITHNRTRKINPFNCHIENIFKYFFLNALLLIAIHKYVEFSTINSFFPR